MMNQVLIGLNFHSTSMLCSKKMLNGIEAVCFQHLPNIRSTFVGQMFKPFKRALKVLLRESKGYKAGPLNENI